MKLLLRLLTLTCAVILLAGCAEMPAAKTPVSPADAFGQKEPIATSLFPSDQAVLSDEAVGRILSSRVELPAKARVALMKFPGFDGSGYYGRYYWRNEQYLKLQQAQVDVLSQALRTSDRITEVTALPSLMTPGRVSIPTLREAAVRMQADLLLVFRVGSDTYSQYRTFAKDKVKAYSTCEMVLLDIRTGLVPFAQVVSREKEETKQANDLSLSETMRRAEQSSTAEALKSAADELVQFMKGLPGR